MPPRLPTDQLQALQRRLSVALGRLRGRRLQLLIALAAAIPPLVVLAVAAHFWSTAGRLASYRPAEPSRLYAAPLVLRVDGPVDRAALVADLQSLGYRRVEHASQPGELAPRTDGLTVMLRPANDDVSIANVVSGSCSTSTSRAAACAHCASTGGRSPPTPP